MSFVHLVLEDEDAVAPFSLADLPAFQPFVASIADRCDEPPQPAGLHTVGSFRFPGDGSS